MVHILGMAKRHLDLRGAKGPKTELDFLKLLVAVRDLHSAGHEAAAYLMVVNPSIADRVRVWAGKYKAGEAVSIVVADLSPAELQMIQHETAANKEGMIAGSLGAPVAGRSSAAAGGGVVEYMLSQLIESQWPGVSRVLDESLFPLAIRWDYYGICR